MKQARLTTEIPGVELRPLVSGDAAALHGLIQASHAHLTTFGDYTDLVAMTLDDVKRYLADPPDANVRMGIWREHELVGRADLVLVAPPNYGLGYWLGAAHCGKGYATAACRALMRHALETCEVEAFWAGVKEANLRSRSVLERLGFTVVEILPSHVRYRVLAGGAQVDAPRRVGA